MQSANHAKPKRRPSPNTSGTKDAGGYVEEKTKVRSF
jgi:hypothetical protein